MADIKKISFSKEYVMEVAISVLRKRHVIPESYATKTRDYGDEYLTFFEVEPTVAAIKSEEEK